MEYALKDSLPPPPDGTAIRGEGGGAVTEEMKLHTFLHMPEDEFANALEEAMGKKCEWHVERVGVACCMSHVTSHIEYGMFMSSVSDSHVERNPCPIMWDQAV